MTARGLATGLVLVSVLLTAARCGSPEELSTLRTALDDGPGVSDGLLHDAAAARSLSGLSTDDRALQHSLLSQTDSRILASAAASMDATAASARQRADAAAVPPSPSR